MRQYFLYFIPFMIIVALAIIFAGHLAPTVPVWLLFIYFTAITAGFHVGLLKASADRPQVFIRYYMATTTVKLLLHLAVIVFYSFINKQHAISFIVTFMIFYAVFTIFEVALTWKQFRRP